MNRPLRVFYAAISDCDSNDYPGVLNETAFKCSAYDMIYNTPTSGIRRYETDEFSTLANYMYDGSAFWPAT